MKPNPPIKGHALLYEGHAFRHFDPVTEDYDGTWNEGCECGERPTPRLNSIGAMKRWHRQHKAELREAQS
jgi:hypothetical protein